jgi:hypothetical protein
MMMNNTTSYTMRDEHCVLGLPAKYDLFGIIASVLLALVGLFNAIFGKTFFFFKLLETGNYYLRLSLLAFNNFYTTIWY